VYLECGAKVTRTRRILLLIAGPVLVVVIGMLLFQKFHYVDPKPAFAVGEGYFSKLQQNKLDEAFDLYTEGFLQKKGQDWQQTVADLDVKAGVVTDFKAQGSMLAPVTLRNRTLIPCVLIRYQVTRGKVVSNEKLTICSHQRGEEWGIAGHEITRSDNGQHFEAGLTILEKKIISKN
jgi:hypothetical protein